MYLLVEHWIASTFRAIVKNAIKNVHWSFCVLGFLVFTYSLKVLIIPLTISVTFLVAVTKFQQQQNNFKELIWSPSLKVWLNREVRSG